MRYRSRVRRSIPILRSTPIFRTIPMPRIHAYRIAACLVAALALAACREAASAVPPHAMEGEWTVTLVMDSPTEGKTMPTTREIGGQFVFSPRLPVLDGEKPPASVAVGRSQVDLAPFFGGPYARDVSTSMSGPVQADYFREMFARRTGGDTVEIIMIPRMSHGGLTLVGRLAGDSAAGYWVQNAFCCGARGRFTMRRVASTDVTDSLVAQAIRANARAEKEAEEARKARARRVGHLRLRVLDEASGRYVEVSFMAEGHQDNADGGTTSLSYASAGGGWGRERALEPGRYDLALYEYPCRGETEMPTDEYVSRMPRVTVRIESGRRVDRDIRLNLDSIQPSIGPKGACMAPASR
jgi:hypothetical protein